MTSAVNHRDRQMAAACAAGDIHSFEEIYKTYGERMKSIAFHQLGNISDAEDAVQETFLKVHRSAGSYSGEAALGTWIYRILVNTCYDLLRKRKRRAEESPLEEMGETGLQKPAANVDEAKRMTLRKLLQQLPEQRRTVFTLFEIEGLSHAEIGSILGITEANSKWILFSTKKDLQRSWKGA